MRPLRRLLLLGVSLLGLAGCAEVDETLHLDGAGSGTYRLVVRWNADLWRRMAGVLGAPVLAGIEGRPLSLRARDWREATAGLSGVEVQQIAERDAGSGVRELRVELAFDSLAQLMRVEMLARRSLRVVTRPAAPGSDRRIAELSMTPLTAVPVLDPLAALLNAVESPPAGARRRATPRDPDPLARAGVKPDEADMIRGLLGPALEQVRFRFRVEVPGTVLRVGGRAVEGRPEHGEQAFDFGTLRDPRADRRVRLTWRVRNLDPSPALDHRGDRADAVRRRPPR